MSDVRRLDNGASTVGFQPITSTFRAQCCLSSSTDPAQPWTRGSSATCPTGIYRHHNSGFCGEFNTLRTYNNAVDWCKSKGGRLCTVDELMNRCASGSGCNGFNKNVWTEIVSTHIHFVLLLYSFPLTSLTFLFGLTSFVPLGL